MQCKSWELTFLILYIWIALIYISCGECRFEFCFNCGEEWNKIDHQFYGPCRREAPTPAAQPPPPAVHTPPPPLRPPRPSSIRLRLPPSFRPPRPRPGLVPGPQPGLVPGPQPGLVLGPPPGTRSLPEGVPAAATTTGIGAVELIATGAATFYHP